MLNFNTLLFVSLAYVALLFAVAFWAERRAARGHFSWLRSPIVYTLSISVYCTAWTFYGAVGSAARNGLEYVAIYLGPTLVFIGWWWLLRKILRIGRAQRITSIADMISSRYGKSPTLAVVVTFLAVVGSTPYIALQLQSITLSFSVFDTGESGFGSANATAFWIAVGLAVFTILFGTRNVDVNERHHGVVTAIALEAVVKLFALLAVGIFVVWGVANGPADIFSRAAPNLLHPENIFSPRWATLVFLSATAIICLPRMFQVTVVENADERHLAVASWAFPFYLFLISLFVLPIAIAGGAILPEGSNPDLFVLSVPLAEGQNMLALFAFLGGFSSATSMVIVAAIALSTMMSNHIVMPLWLRASTGLLQTSGDVKQVLLVSRRISIGVVLLLGYLYFRLTGGSTALAAIGLVSFAGIAQVMPALIGGLFWRGATRKGALVGMIGGFIIWAYTLFLPSFDGGFILSAQTLANGPFGWEMLRPQTLFGLDFGDDLVHSMFWAMTVNTGLFIAVSLGSTPTPLERLQSTQFVDVFRLNEGSGGYLIARSATAEDLYTLAQRILGADAAHALFTRVARAQGRSSGLPEATDDFVQVLERELSGSVGGASAHAMVSQIAGGGMVSVDELMKIADETAQIMEYSQQVEAQSRELAETAQQLRQANAKLTELGAQKDAFLSQVSHELRTPMTSIRSFSEILRETKDLSDEKAQRFAGIIRDESERLTRILDEILDLSHLESGRVNWVLQDVPLQAVIDRALNSAEALISAAGVRIVQKMPETPLVVHADFDRLAQVFINLITNAVKYGISNAPEITIHARRVGKLALIGVIDNGPGIAPHEHMRVFEKFSRLSSETLAGSAGLGLPISREIMRNLHGDLTLEDNAPGAVFRVSLPLADYAPR
ncbi:ATP-binding protein [Abyssibius alkaniclasticus]|uniref:ATP-binding protein n=1 Tax=Abyssibius alkaniclasticus TaxID=2881234 RepID=UPI004058E53C